MACFAGQPGKLALERKTILNFNEARFGRLLRPPAWKRSGSIFWKVRDRRRNRREDNTHKKGRRKNTNRKGKQKQKYK